MFNLISLSLSLFLFRVPSSTWWNLAAKTTDDRMLVTRSSKIALIRKTLPSLIDVCLHVRVGALLPLPRKRTFPLYLHTIPSVYARLLLVDSFFAQLTRIFEDRRSPYVDWSSQPPPRISHERIEYRFRERMKSLERILIFSPSAWDLRQSIFPI